GRQPTFAAGEGVIGHTCSNDVCSGHRQLVGEVDEQLRSDGAYGIVCRSLQCLVPKSTWVEPNRGAMVPHGGARLPRPDEGCDGEGLLHGRYDAGRSVVVCAPNAGDSGPPRSGRLELAVPFGSWYAPGLGSAVARVIGVYARRQVPKPVCGFEHNGSRSARLIDTRRGLRVAGED